MAKFAITPNLTFCSRSDWAPKDFPRLGEWVPRAERTHVFIHHTCGCDKDASPNLWETEEEIFQTMRHLQTCRGSDLGNDVPYNFVAFMTPLNDGLYICEGRGEDRTGAHTKGHNYHAIAVSFAGDFENRIMPEAELSKRMLPLSNFLGWLRHSPSHPDYGEFKPMRHLTDLQPKRRKVFFHQDVKNTDCPGATLLMHLEGVDFIQP